MYHFFEFILQNLSIKSISDIGCLLRQINYIQEINSRNIFYIGIDVISKNVKEYRLHNSKNIFTQLDPLTEPIPSSDLVIYSQCISKLPVDDIWNLLNNIKDSKAKYLLIKDMKKSQSILGLPPFFIEKSLFNNHENGFSFYKISDVSHQIPRLNKRDSETRSIFLKKFDAIIRELSQILISKDNLQTLLESFLLPNDRRIEAITQESLAFYMQKNAGYGYKLDHLLHRIAFRTDLEEIKKEIPQINENNLFYFSNLLKSLIKSRISG